MVPKKFADKTANPPNEIQAVAYLISVNSHTWKNPPNWKEGKQIVIG
jgi:hypothetical protein